MHEIASMLDTLNEQQREAVLENSHPLLVLAGAGSGKTRVITTKIAYAIRQLNLPAYRILAVTFTNKAAEEMRQRVKELLDGDSQADECIIRTFHSFGAWLLRRFGSEIGLNPNFTIYDDEDSLSLLSSCFPSYKKKELEPVMRRISYAKDHGYRPSDKMADMKVDATFKRMFEAYEQKLHSIGNVDFADLINRTIELLETSSSVRSWVHRRFSMILVDEYQDSNAAQFNLLKQLVGPGCFVCVVGDDDQSIYRFRGAEVRNILSFPDVYPGTRIIKLEQNYRSTKQILDIANTVIQNNKGRHAKRLWTANESGKKPNLLYIQDEQDEAQRVGSILQEDKRFDQSAVLYRTNAQSVAFETVFKRMGIPYKVVGALPFYSREEVKDGLALLYLLINEKDEISFKRIINKPARGIGPSALDSILSLSGQTDGNLFAMMSKAVNDQLLSGKAKSGALHFIRMFEQAKSMLAEGSLIDSVNFLLHESNLVEYYQDQDAHGGTEKAKNLDSLVNAISSYESSFDGLVLFLEQLTLDPTTLGDDDPRKRPGVTLITMHNTKGLEFDRVFVAGLEDELFPGRSCECGDDLEEERRIFYVAVTRARRELYLLSARTRKIWGNMSFQTPSRFLKEIDPSLITIQGIGKPQSGFGGFASASSYNERRRVQAVDAAGLIRQGFGQNPKTFNMKTVHTQKEGEALFPVGQRVYSDNYGEGEVVNVRMSGDREVIEVRFSGGRKATFISKFAQLEKLGRE